MCFSRKFSQESQRERELALHMSEAGGGRRQGVANIAPTVSFHTSTNKLVIFSSSFFFFSLLACVEASLAAKREREGWLLSSRREKGKTEFARVLKVIHGLETKKIKSKKRNVEKTIVLITILSPTFPFLAEKLLQIVHMCETTCAVCAHIFLAIRGGRWRRAAADGGGGCGGGRWRRVLCLV